MGSQSITRSRTRRIPWGLLVWSTLLALGTIALIWFAAVPFGPLVCPAIDPAPSNCSAVNRAGTGFMMTVIVSGIYLAIVLLTVLMPRVRGAVAIGGVTVLVVAPVISYVVIAWSPGFPL